MLRIVTLGLTAVVVAVLSACTPDYSPNTYSGNAVQHANKVERAIVVGYREIAISANGTLGAVEGGAAGGILGSQSGDIGLNAALGAVGGTVIGGLVGTTLEHVTADTTGWEYIVRKENGDLLSVTQREPTPLPIGQRVLVITGNQARIIADYSVPLPLPPKAAAKASTDAKDGKEATAAKEPAAAKTAESKPPADAKATPSPEDAAAKVAPAAAPVAASSPAATEPTATTAASATPAATSAAPAATAPTPLVAASPPASEPPASSPPRPITPVAAASAPTPAAAPASEPEPATAAAPASAPSASEHNTP